MTINKTLLVIAAIMAAASFDCSAGWVWQNRNHNRTAEQVVDDAVGSVKDTADDLVADVKTATGTGTWKDKRGRVRDKWRHRGNRKKS